MMDLWLRAQDEDRLRNTYDIDLHKSSFHGLDADPRVGTLVTGKLENHGLLSAYERDFTLAYRHGWKLFRGWTSIAVIRDRITPPGTLVLTPYKYVGPSGPGIKRVTMIGNLDDPFVGRVFTTYYSDEVERISPKDNRLLLLAKAGAIRDPGVRKYK